MVISQTVVVIPFRDHWPMTEGLVRSLGTDDTSTVLLYDNGSSSDHHDAARRTVATCSRVELHDATGMSLHEMWNDGVYQACRRHETVNVAILNNDLRISPGFLAGLVDVLRSDDRIQAVCPNYDGRPVRDSPVPLRGICEGRYDGSGGLSGFAFMVKGEWFSNGWTFPRSPRWWFGDRMLADAMDRAGAHYAMATAVPVEHIGGGSQSSGDWNAPALRAAAQADRDAYLRHPDTSR